MQSPPQYNPVVIPGNIPGLSSPPMAMPSIPRFHGDLDNLDVADLMAVLQSQAESRQSITVQPVTIPADVLLLLLRQRQRQDPWAIGLLVGGVTALFVASMVALFMSPSQRLTNQNEVLINQNAALSRRSAKLAEDVVNKPRCSFVLVCPN